MRGYESLNPGLELRAVSKRCGPDGASTLALDEVSFALRPGRLSAIIGENGAGKSTAVKLFGGLHRPDEGTVLIDGEPFVDATPRAATARGVGLVHQHFSLVPSFRVLENLMLGHEPAGAFGVLAPEVTRAAATELMARTGLTVSLDAITGDLGVGAKQRVEILRVLLRAPRAVLLDEPTAILLPQEVNALYELLRGLVAAGTTVGIVTHYVGEVVRYADDVTVLRRGRVVLSEPVAEHTEASLSRAALGEAPKTVAFAAPAPAPGDVAGAEAATGGAAEEDAAARLEISGFSLHPAGGEAGKARRTLSLSVKRGEIVGIAGIDGNGQDELLRGLGGLVEPGQQHSRGSIRVDGVGLGDRSVAERRAAGLEVVHGDRLRWGVVPDATVGDNLVLGELANLRTAEAAAVEQRLARSGAVPADATRPLGSLSGGNQQKVVVERALAGDPRALVVGYPTRGIDAGAAAILRGRIVAQAARGAAVVVISADLTELRAMCHRLLVLVDGAIVATFSPDIGEAELGAAMLSKAAAP
jgi:general nucleoside transport system ATP-binding protein